jgi:uncharacterized membrane protein HdeD (DUF308 family)
MVFGVLLIALGAVGYAEIHFIHAAIPGFFGFALVICGMLATTTNLKHRARWMHGAVLVGLLGFLGTVMSLPRIVQMAAGKTIVNPVGAEDQAATCVLCLVFVLLCVRSFIAARRARLSAS